MQTFRLLLNVFLIELFWAPRTASGAAMAGACLIFGSLVGGLRLLVGGDEISIDWVLALGASGLVIVFVNWIVHKVVSKPEIEFSEKGFAIYTQPKGWSVAVKDIPALGIWGRIAGYSSVIFLFAVVILIVKLTHGVIAGMLF
jgi:hypothetical protein